MKEQPTPELSFAKWLEENTKVIYEEKITLYRYCDKNNEYGNYILEDIYTEFKEVEQPTPAPVSVEEKIISHEAIQNIDWNTIARQFYKFSNEWSINQTLAEFLKWASAAQLQSAPKQSAGVELEKIALKIALDFSEKFQDNYPDKKYLWKLMDELKNEILTALQSQQLQSQQQEPDLKDSWKDKEMAKLAEDFTRLQTQIEDYKHILKTFTDCPDLIIHNPGLLRNKKPTDEDIEWAIKDIKKFEQQEEKINLEENEYLDFSKMEVSEEAKKEFINAVTGRCAKEILKVFLGCSLKTHIEQMIKEENTGTEYVLTFQTNEMFLRRFKPLTPVEEDKVLRVLPDEQIEAMAEKLYPTPKEPFDKNEYKERIGWIKGVKANICGEILSGHDQMPHVPATNKVDVPVDNEDKIGKAINFVSGKINKYQEEINQGWRGQDLDLLNVQKFAFEEMKQFLQSL